MTFHLPPAAAPEPRGAPQPTGALWSLAPLPVAALLQPATSRTMRLRATKAFHSTLTITICLPIIVIVMQPTKHKVTSRVYWGIFALIQPLIPFSGGSWSALGGGRRPPGPRKNLLAAASGFVAAPPTSSSSSSWGRPSIPPSVSPSVCRLSAVRLTKSFKGDT